MNSTLTLRHFLYALVVVAIWGSNFVVIKLGLQHLPPLFFAALRFLLAFFPAALLLPRPKVRLSNLLAYGVFIGAGQFGLLYVAMRGYISPGLASLVVQMQVFMTIGLSMLITHERVLWLQWVALVTAISGLLFIAAHVDSSVSTTGLLLVLGAAACWACGNTISRQAGRINMLSYVVWSSIFAVPVLLGLSIWLEGWGAIQAGISQAGWDTWLAVVWQSVGNTLFGYAMWGWLLSRYAASTVAPLAFLVPVFGMSSSAFFLHEPMQAWKLQAAALVIAGLVINYLAPKLLKK